MGGKDLYISTELKSEILKIKGTKMAKETGLKKYSLDGFLPQADMQYIDQIRGQELQKYKELLFNAERDGFSDQLE